jgi:hypothetical protein
MAQDPLETIRNLIARAGSDNEHEARTSAVLALKLMKKHGVVLTLPGEIPPPVSPSAVVSDPVPDEPFFVPTKKPLRRVRDLHGSEWSFYETGPGGGRCIMCDIPIIRGVAFYMGDPGLVHLGCWSQRQAGATRSARATATGRPHVTPATPGPPPAPPPPVDEASAVDSVWEFVSKIPR